MTETTPSIASLLIVDDERAQLTALRNTLMQRGYAAVGVASAEDALSALRTQSFDLVLTDLTLPQMDGIGLLREALAIDPTLVVILMTGHGTIETAVEAMRAGALDYILKPFNLSAVLPVLTRALDVRRLRLDNARLQQSVAERGRELEAANLELDAFTFTVSHDLRAPLRAVNGYATILLEEHAAELSPAARELFERLTRSVGRMNRLIDDLLRFSRFSRQALHKEPVFLPALVSEVIDELPGVETSGRRVDFRIMDLPTVTADRALLKQVLVNLLSNAVKFSRRADPPIVEIGCRHEPSGEVLYVRDNGVGFDMSHAGRLFEVFQRLQTDEGFEGAGVGLSIARRVIERHGGRIWADAAPGEGAAFFFVLGP